ncbi:rhomboid-related protein 3-like [Littorina saxatilis]|uniref:rhomboid protease n=1 Tax=Littorina saxatilis TaxID=31220 RepID=A0AAN9BWY5_9CAEN
MLLSMDPEQKWKPLFDQYDPYRRGEILIEDFAYLLRHPQIRAEMDSHTLDVLEVKANEPCRTTVSYQEFVNLLSNRRNPSFRLAVESRVEGEVWTGSVVLRSAETRARPDTCFRRMVRRLAKDFLTDEADRRYYADRYTCCPPPLFVPIITLLEVGCFVYYCMESRMITLNGPVPVHSIFIYRPDRRLEIWRFVLYMLLHAGYVHLLFNVIVQVVVGIPLEMVHGSFRIFIVYMAGVLAGSLGTSVFDMNAFLVGASGGVYALLAAHLANILLNYSQMELGVLKLAAVLIIASADVGFAIWDRYTYKELAPPVGYTAHLMGALAGLTIGLVVLKNFEQKLHEQYVWWIALAVYLGCVVFAIFWNIFYY